MLVLLRYLNNIEPEYIDAEEQKYSKFYDAGLKVNFTNNTVRHLNLAIESIYRKVKSPTLMTAAKPSTFKDGAYRFAFNAEQKLFVYACSRSRFRWHLYQKWKCVCPNKYSRSYRLRQNRIVFLITTIQEALQPLFFISIREKHPPQKGISLLKTTINIDEFCIEPKHFFCELIKLLNT